MLSSFQPRRVFREIAKHKRCRGKLSHFLLDVTSDSDRILGRPGKKRVEILRRVAPDLFFAQAA